jgi:hypothetical protein
MSLNPFASTAADFGSLIFGGAAEDSPAPGAEDIVDETSHDTTSFPQEASPLASLWTLASSTTLEAHYIDTAAESLAAPSSSKSRTAQLAKKMGSLDLDGCQEPKQPHKGGRVANASSSKGKAASDNDGWSGEGYEVMKLSGVEEVFLAFQERLESSGAQDQLVRSVTWQVLGLPQG